MHCCITVARDHLAGHNMPTHMQGHPEQDVWLTIAQLLRRRGFLDLGGSRGLERRSVRGKTIGPV
eukprot:9346850-Prorocentrum_lima.AAC.1